MLLICVLSFTINNGIPWLVKDNVEGKLVSEGQSKYLVDFTNGLKKFPLTVDPQNYNKVLVKKTDCVKE
jgi:hypothetical protein